MNVEPYREEAERDFEALCVAAGYVSGGIRVEQKNYSYTDKCPMDWYNKVFDIRFPGSGFDKHIEELTARMAAGEIPPNVFLSSKMTAEGRDEQFFRAGFTLVYEQTAMTVGNTRRPPSLEAGGGKGPSGGTGGIRRVESGRDLDGWIECLELAFSRKRDKALYEKLAGIAGIDLWGLWEGDIPVSTLLIQKTGGTAGLHLVSTHPGYRKKGYGAKIVDFALDISFSGGAESVVLLSSPMAKSLYESLGFTAYGKVKHLKYEGPAAVT
jgi:GNAT superfamily N-acetyltransferase